MAPVNKLRLDIFEILDKVRKSRAKNDKIAILRKNESWALKDVLGGTFDENVEWNLPLGEPPYKPSDPHNAPTNLHRQNTQFRNFFKGGPGDKLSVVKRESLFIGLLEGIHPEDAKVVINMINKKKPEGITRAIVEEAFPGLTTGNPDLTGVYDNDVPRDRLPRI
tara:strand:+ start:3183 stop:3677 length:495 start_codon:yes stop_codon:yes gene_type:complete